MPIKWSRHHPVIVQSLLKEVISTHAQLLYDRAYEAIWALYVQEAQKRGLTVPTAQGIKQVVTRKLLEWEKTLKEGGTLS